MKREKILNSITSSLNWKTAGEKIELGKKIDNLGK